MIQTWPCQPIAALALRPAICVLFLRCALAGMPLLAGEPAEVDFARDIRPIFNQNCVSCHGGVKQAAKISFIYRDAVVAQSANEDKPIHPGDPDNSELIYRVTTDNEDDRMPPADHADALSEHQINLLRAWVQQGAKWKEHWAWIKPEEPVKPRVSKPAWIRQPLDAFALAKLDAVKLKPAPEADRIQWLRRASFDLTGLPPTLEEIKAFTQDKSPGAYEKVVQRLLASPLFGERWASPWLDAARHADSMGYEKDPLRTVWPYRDWVIRALNDDLPFDQFTIKQLAGDLLPGATMADRIATTFHRNTQVNTEGGTDDEEFRIAAVMDRVNTTWEVWQGTTMRCVQCHSHPYEPIKHEEYYRSFALFNTTRDWDLADETPALQVPTNTAAFEEAQRLDAEISAGRMEEFHAAGKLAARELGWQALTPSLATATKGTRLIVQTNDIGAAEVRTSGTVAHHSRFIITSPLPAGITNLGALQVEVLPENPETARFTPETGFVISQLRLAIVTNLNTSLDETDGNDKTNTAPENRIKLAHCFGDEPEPFQEPDSAVREDHSGWGANPRLMQARRAVFVPEKATAIPAGAFLQIVIAHDFGKNDMGGLVTRRLRLSVTASNDWVEFCNSAQFTGRRTQLAELTKRRSAIPSVKLPVMQEQAAPFRRITAVFERGNWLAKGETVQPGVPKVFEANADASPSNRLAFAQWLVSPANPLTSRVTVNRLWNELFGVGLVETVEDFGSSGQPPSNQPLLDHLALRFQHDLGWSLKKLLREIVLSATYRQDAHASTSLVARDPANRLLGRGPRGRLSAEMIRDQALAVSGLLSPKMFGPPVMPLQPDGIWDVIYSKEKWETSPGEDRHRRALYTFIRRTTGYPSAGTFDSPSREFCVTRRIKTNTPLQALVTLNDPVYVECAVGLAARMRHEAGNRVARQIARGYQLATGRPPTAAELRTLSRLHANALARYEAHPELAKQFAGTPAEAALALVANALLNLDATLTK